MASSNPKLHGRVEGARDRCAVPGCREPGEFKAPLAAGQFRRPRRLAFPVPRACPRAQCEVQFLRRNEPRRDFRGAVALWPAGSAQRAPSLIPAPIPAPAWSDFADPLDAISGRFRRPRQPETSRFTRAEQRALSILGLGEDADLKSVRSSYSKLVRRFHPDRNGGDRSHEGRLREVIEAYQTLRKAAAFV